MELEFECPACFATITVDSAMHGRHVQCPACEAVVSVPRIDLEPGMEIGNFVLQSRLGAGGMGEVWLARQATMERDVALKILNPELSADKEFVARFLKEVRISAQLDHKNIVTAHDAGNATGFHYLAMSYIDGIELEAKLKGGLISEKEALGIARDIADALGYAWNKSNLLHRDIKPENIMVTADGSARLMDMGISKSRDEMSLTMTGMVVGTPYYMSPEQGRGSAEIDCRSDIYSLGATLYHALTGSVPFDAGTHVAILTQHATDPLPPPRRRNPKLSAPCAALIEKMMAKKPEQRQQTWEEVIADIDKVLAGRMPGASAGGNSRRFLVAGIAAAALLAAVVAVAAVLSAGRRGDAGQGSPVEIAATPEPPPPPTVDGPPPSETPSGMAVLAGNDPADGNAQEERRLREMWDFAAEFARGAIERSEDFDIATSHMERLKNAASGSKFELMAETEIAKITNAKNTAIDNAWRALEGEAKELADKHEYASAVSVMEGYRGGLAAETADRRTQAATEFRRLAKQHEAAKGDIGGRVDELMREAAAKLLDGDRDGAARDIATAIDERDFAAHQDKLREAARILEDLTSIDQFVAEGINAKAGQSATLPVDGKKQLVTINDVEPGGQVVVTIEEDRVKFRKRFAIKDMNAIDKLPWLGGMPADSRALHVAMLALAARRPDQFERHLGQTGVWMSPIIAATRNRAEREAEERATAEAEENQRRDAAKMAEKFKNLFRGEMVSFNQETLEIELAYDFRDGVQGADWRLETPGMDRMREGMRRHEPDHRPGPGGGPHFQPRQPQMRIESRSLRLSANGPMANLTHKARFKEVSIEFQAIFQHDGLAAFLDGQRGNLYYMLAAQLLNVHDHNAERAAIERSDAYALNLHLPGTRLERVRQTTFRPNTPVSGKFGVADNMANMRAEQFEWPAVRLDLESVEIGFSSRAELQINSVRIKGIIDREWLERELGRE